METQRMGLHLKTRVSNLPPSLGFTFTSHAISITLQEETREFLQDESGTTLVSSSSSSPSSPIILHPRHFFPRHLSRLLGRHNIPFPQEVADHISRFRYSRPNCTLQAPFLMSVNVNVIKELRLVLLPSLSLTAPGASVDVFKRLLDQQSIESSSELGDETTCSICLDQLLPLSESDSNIIKMPRCLHLFHQNCIFEWLSRHNSCPLCRRVPYEDETEIQRSS